jgi:hypothetical protein
MASIARWFRTCGFAVAFALAHGSPALALDASATNSGAAQATLENAVMAELGRQRALIGLLSLQSAMALGRPFHREWLVLSAALPRDLIPESMRVVLTRHAPRGVAPIAELRTQLAVLAATLQREERTALGCLERAGLLTRGALASLGLMEPPPPSPLQLALARMDVVLGRSQLGAAVTEAGTLEPRLLDLLEGWLVEARIRLATEQAVQEAILRALSP